MRKILFSVFLCSILIIGLNAQTLTNHKNEEEAKKNAGQGVTFKIPSGVMPLEWKKNGFKGLLLLAQHDPTGIFITYPDDGETIEAVTLRAKSWIAPMFIHDDKKADKFEWKSSDLPLHKGDKAAKLYLYEAEKQSVQVLVYEREWSGLTFIYGYFAMKSDKSKEKDVKKMWANEKGEGIKVFDKFWKTFPNK
jgi:hypothetical protein